MTLLRSHKIQENVVGDVATDCLTAGLVESVMDSSVNAALGYFISHCGKTWIRTCPSRRTFPSMLKSNIVVLEKGSENRSVRHTDHCLISCICRVWRSD